MPFNIKEIKNNKISQYQNKIKWPFEETKSIISGNQNDNRYLIGLFNKEVVSILIFKFDIISIDLLYVSTNPYFQRRGYATELVTYLKNKYLNNYTIIGNPTSKTTEKAMIKWGFTNRQSISDKTINLWEIPRTCKQ